MERHRFPEGEEPSVLTAVLAPCRDGKHAECPGHDEHEGKAVFCICFCHRVFSEVQ